MRTQAKVKASTCLLMGCLWFSAQSSDATTATWINTANGGYWTNSVNWNASQYPGQDGANQNAYLTNRVDGAVYRAVIDTALPYAVGTVEIKNLGTSGEAWLIVTNAVLAYTNLSIRTNGRLQIDSGGVVTNGPGFATGLGFTLDATNGQIVINSGGSLFASTNSVVGLNSGGRSNVLNFGEGSVLAITNGSLSVGSGTGASYNRLLVTNNNVRIRTSLAPYIGANGNLNEALFTGTGTVWDCSGSRFFVGSGGVSNLMTVSQGSLWITNTTQNLWVGYSTANAYNRLVVTNGGRFYAQGGVAIGYNGIGSNTVTVTGTGSLLDCNGGLIRASDSGGLNNVMLVDQAGTVSNAYVNVGQNLGAYGNSLILANGAKWFGGTAGTGSAIGNICTGNLAVVTGQGTLWDLNAKSLTVGTGTAGIGNTLRIDNYGVVTNVNGLSTGASGGSSNTLTVVGGGQLFTSGASTIGSSSATNFARITGAESLWNCTVQAITVGTGAAAIGNEMRIENGAVVTNSGILSVGASGGVSNTLFVTSGGKYWTTAGYSDTLGGSASGNSIRISGDNSRFGGLGIYCNMTIGSVNATGNVMVVDNGASCPTWSTLSVGRGTNCVGNSLIITNGGYLQAVSAYANFRGTNSWNNTVLIANGGVLESGTLAVDSGINGTVPNGYNNITNGGGVYQFTTTSPTVTPVPAHTSLVYLTDGTISFRAVTAANVRGNWSGSQLTNILFTGNNAFRLDSSTNATSPDQTYTFANNLGPTNYARLELFNGSLYQGGSVTIGSGGTLALSGTPSTITNLTIASGGTLEVTVSGTNSASRLNAVGSVALGGTLRIILAAAPPPAGFDWTLISKSGAVGITGGFTGGTVLEQAYQGTNYVFRINATGGDGNDLVLHSLGRSIPGTMMLVL